MPNKSLMSFSKIYAALDRKVYRLHDAHLVDDLVRINNGTPLKIMDIIANHTGLSLNEVCEKGMTGIWTKILNEAVSRKVNLVGYSGLPIVLSYIPNHISTNIPISGRSLKTSNLKKRETMISTVR